MSTEIHSEPTMNQLPEASREIARRAAEAAKETVQRAKETANDVASGVEGVAREVKDAAKCAGDTAKEVYQSAAVKAAETLATSKEYVRRNPVPVVLGAVAFGVTIGYMLVMARRKPTFGERYADEPLVAVREAILDALAPVTQRFQRGYDSARESAGKVMDQAHGFSPGRTSDSFADQIGRIGTNLKFW